VNSGIFCEVFVLQVLSTESRTNVTISPIDLCDLMITSEEPGIEPGTLYSQFITLLYSVDLQKSPTAQNDLLNYQRYDYHYQYYVLHEIPVKDLYTHTHTHTHTIRFYI
jgi:hypothetical protein